MEAVWLFSYFRYYSFSGHFEVGVEQKMLVFRIVYFWRKRNMFPTYYGAL